MQKLLIIAGLFALAAFLFKEWKAVRKVEKIDTEVERFRYIENLDQSEVTIKLILMSKEDKEALLNVLLNKSEHNINYMLLARMIQLMLIEEN